MAAARVSRDAAERDDRGPERAAMVRQVREEFAATADLGDASELDPDVAAALERVPRHWFVPASLSHLAYTNRPLPIGCGQTISQPFIVAFMTQLGRVGSDSHVLEVGTGSGYQAAVLSQLARQVYSVEIVRELADRAAACLMRLGCSNVRVRHSDGFEGWREYAPFDVILVTAAAASVPPPLLGQLAAGGRMVLPVGDPGHVQDLVLLEKRADGVVESYHKLPVSFVPLIRAGEFGTGA